MTMRGAALVTICLVVFGTTVYGSPVGNCPAVDPLSHTDHLPDDKNCSLFYKCDHASPVLFHCPDGLHFNRILEVCDWPANAGCHRNSDQSCPAVGECPQNEDENSIAKHLPHAYNCSLFCKCDHGKPVTFDCPAGLHFNPVLEVCDKPEDAGCISDPGSSTASPSSVAPPHPNGDCPAIGECPQNEDENSIAKHLPHAYNCSLFCKCDHGKPVTFDCPAGLHFNPVLEVCDNPEDAGCISGPRPSTASPSSVAPPDPNGNCPAIGECPQNEDENSIAKHLPHATDCGKFCKCDHGNPVTFDCPPGLHFNPNLEVCDWPEHAGCVNASAICDAVGSCPEYDQDSIVKHLPHRTNCGLYCRCDHGVPITEKCPDGLHFNAELEVCDWPADAGCEK